MAAAVVDGEQAVLKLRHGKTMTLHDLSKLTTAPNELLSVPSVEYKIASYTLNEHHHPVQLDYSDPTCSADIPPLVHDLPPEAQQLRISVPRRLVKSTPPAMQLTGPQLVRHLNATSSAASQHDSLNINVHLAPGRAAPVNAWKLAKAQGHKALDLYSEDGMPNKFMTGPTSGAPLFTRRYHESLDSVLHAVPDIRSMYDSRAAQSGANWPTAGVFLDKSNEELAKLAHLRAGLQILNAKLVRRTMNPGVTDAKYLASPYPTL